MKVESISNTKAQSKLAGIIGILVRKTSSAHKNKKILIQLHFKKIFKSPLIIRMGSGGDKNQTMSQEVI